MTKKLFKKLPSRTAIFTILGGAFLCIALLLSSCDHFMEGAKTSEALEKVIAYANTPAYKILVEADKDSGIITKPAAGEADVKETDIFNLAFNAESDHQFIRWEVYDAATGNEIKDNPYLKIENPDMIDTTCTVLALPKDEKIKLAVRAVAAQRPQVLLSRPGFTEEGTKRNARIQALFTTKDMDENCIYYTEQEMNDLKKQLGLTDTNFLQGNTRDCKDRYYGYIKDDKKYFKNIQITSNFDKDSSKYWAINHFYDPHWEEDDLGSRLVIYTMNPPPKEESTIYVTLSKNFCYYFDDVPVKLKEPEVWIYKTQVKDDTNPTFSRSIRHYIDNKDVMQFKDSSSEEYKSLPKTKANIVENSSTYGMPKITDPQNHPNYPDTIPVCSERDYIMLRLNISASDRGGSGLKDEFSICCFKAGGAWADLGYQDAIYNYPYLYYGPDEDPKSDEYIGTTMLEESFYYEGWDDIEEWSDEYAYILPREGILAQSGIFCFILATFDNYGNSNMSRFQDEPPDLFWIELQ